MVNNQLGWSFPQMPCWDGEPHAIVLVIVSVAFTVVSGGVCDDGDALLSPSSSRSSLLRSRYPSSYSSRHPPLLVFFPNTRKEPHANTEDKTFEVRTTNLFKSKNSVKVRLLYQVLYKKGVWGIKNSCLWTPPQFGQPSKFAPAGRAPRAQWKKKN